MDCAAESLGRAAPFVSPGAGLTADTSFSTSLRQSHDALGSWPVAAAEETRWCPGSGRWDVLRSEIKEEDLAAGQRRGDVSAAARPAGPIRRNQTVRKVTRERPQRAGRRPSRLSVYWVARRTEQGWCK